MNITKKIIYTILVTMMMLIVNSTLSVFAVNYGEELKNIPEKTSTQIFNDVPSSYWAYDYIGEMVNRGVLNGYPNGKFYPDNKVTRAEFSKIMTIASGISVTSPTYKYFNDVETNAWYAPYVHAAYPFLSGYVINGSRYYQPQSPALREDIAVALVRLKGYDTLGYDESVLTTMFTDAYSISTSARPYVATAVERGLISGYEDDTFRGQQGITRAEAATLLWRAYQYGNDNKEFGVVEPVATIEVPVVTTPPIATPIITATPRPTLSPTAIPLPTATPVPEKRYVADNVYGLKVTKHCYDENHNMIYYLNENNNTVYSLDPDTTSCVEVVCLDDIYMYPDGEFLDDPDPDTAREDYYKEFTISTSGMYYDSKYDRLILCGHFNKKTDIDGLEDMSYIFRANIIVDNGLTLLDTNGSLIKFFIDEKTYGFINDNNIYLPDWTKFYGYHNSNNSQYRPCLYKDGYIYYMDRSITSPNTCLLKTNLTSEQVIKEIHYSKVALKDEMFYYIDSDTNNINSCDLTGKQKHILNINKDIENKDYDPIEGEFYVCDDDTYVFFTSRNIKLVYPQY